MFFRKKKKEERPVPIDEIHSLTQMGLSDEEIVKKLRAEGYSYEAIQKGMFQAIRDEVGSRRSQQFPNQQPQNQQQESLEPMAEGNEEIDFEDFEPDLEPIQNEPAQDVNVEDLIETILQEKIGDSIESIKTLKENYKNLETEIKKIQDKINSLPKSQDVPVEEIKKRMDELESRIGGLERAFKQLLPSLSRNLDSFSKMVSQMKQAPQPQQQPYPQQFPNQQQQEKKKKYDDISSSDFYGQI